MADPNKTGDRAAQSKLEINKDLFVVLIPLLGSALAVTFNVGYFSGINLNLFSIFSLSEHTVSALEVLPEALMFAFVVGLLAVYIQQVPPLINKYKLGLIILLMAVSGGLWYFALWYFTAQYLLGIGTYLLGIGTLIAFGFCLYVWLETESLVARVATLCTAAVVLDFMLGYSMATAYLADAKNATPTTIETNAGVRIDARLIRSGDRGVLFIDPCHNNRVNLLKWDEIKEISTAAATH
jgi:hypothetical protein